MIIEVALEAKFVQVLFEAGVDQLMVMLNVSLLVFVKATFRVRVYLLPEVTVPFKEAIATFEFVNTTFPVQLLFVKLEHGWKKPLFARQLFVPLTRGISLIKFCAKELLKKTIPKSQNRIFLWQYFFGSFLFPNILHIVRKKP